MSEHIQHAIDEFEATIAKLTTTVESLRWFQREFPHTAASMVRAPAPEARPKKAKAGKRDGTGRDGTGREQTSRQRAPRSLPDGESERVIAALRHKSPQKPAELARTLKLTLFQLRARTKPLVKAKLVIATGATMNRQFSLPGRTNGPKEEP